MEHRVDVGQAGGLHAGVRAAVPAQHAAVGQPGRAFGIDGQRRVDARTHPGIRRRADVVRVVARQAQIGAHPQRAFAVFQQRHRHVGRQAVAAIVQGVESARVQRRTVCERRRRIDPVDAAMHRLGTPQMSLAIEQQPLGMHRRAVLAGDRAIGRARVRRRQAGQGPGTLGPVRQPQSSVRRLRDRRVAHGAHAGARETPGATGQIQQLLAGGDPQRAVAVGHDPIRAFGGITPVGTGDLPALAVEACQTAAAGRPQRAAPVPCEGEHHAGGEAVARRVVREMSVAQRARAAVEQADPQRAVRLHRQRGDVVGAEALALRRLEALEGDAVEAVQARARAQPQEAVGILRQRPDIRWRAAFHAPHRLAELLARPRTGPRVRGLPMDSRAQQADAQPYQPGRDARASFHARRSRGESMPPCGPTPSARGLSLQAMDGRQSSDRR